MSQNSKREWDVARSDWKSSSYHPQLSLQDRSHSRSWKRNSDAWVLLYINYECFLYAVKKYYKKRKLKKKLKSRASLRYFYKEGETCHKMPEFWNESYILATPRSEQGEPNQVLWLRPKVFSLHCSKMAVALSLATDQIMWVLVRCLMVKFTTTDCHNHQNKQPIRLVWRAA